MRSVSSARMQQTAVVKRAAIVPNPLEAGDGGKGPDKAIGYAAAVSGVSARSTLDVHTLHTLDNAIELNLQIRETVADMAQAPLRARFVDFEHVRAKKETARLRREFFPSLPVKLYNLSPAGASYLNSAT